MIQKKDKNHWFPRCGYRIRIMKGAGAEYALVTLYSGRVRWERLRGEIADTSNRAVLQRGLLLPEESGIQPVGVQAFEYQLLKNAAVQFLKEASLPMKDISVTLIDLRGVYHDLARMLVQFCGKLKVVTLHLESYQELSAQLLHETGAVFQITDVFQSPNDNLVIVSPSGFSVDFGGKVGVPIFTLEPQCFRNAVLVYGFRLHLPEEYAGEFPETMDDMQLLSALYSIEGRLELRNAVPSSCRLNGKETDFRQLGHLVGLDTKPEVAYN